eukprot:2950260-Rhodomonas_salina.1
MLCRVQTRARPSARRARYCRAPARVVLSCHVGAQSAMAVPHIAKSQKKRIQKKDSVVPARALWVFADTQFAEPNTELWATDPDVSIDRMYRSSEVGRERKEEEG